MRCDLVVGLMLVCSVAAQDAVSDAGNGVELANGTGKLVPPEGWTVLRQAELEAAERPTDPTTPYSRSVLMAALDELRKNERTSHNIVLHRQGPGTDELRLLNCYSAEVVASSEELLGKEAVEQIRDAIVEQMSNEQTKVKCTGFETSQLWKIPSLVLHFEHDGEGSPWQMGMQIVPAGDHLQYFECQFTVSDTAARQSFQEVLATFDGAKEPGSRVSNLLIGGLAGAVAGVLTALFRRNRQQQRMSAAGS